MITKSTTMLYVEDTKAALNFWIEKMGFILLDTSDYGEAVSYEIAPSEQSAIAFGLHDKNWVAKNSPMLNLEFPSLLLTTDNLEEEYEQLKNNGVQTNPIMEMNGLYHFTFTDNEGHFIAIRQS